MSSVKNIDVHGRLISEYRELLVRMMKLRAELTSCRLEDMSQEDYVSDFMPKQADVEIRMSEILYKRFGGNPFHVWTALYWSLETDSGIPEWVHEYFYNNSIELRLMMINRRPSSNSTVADAMNMRAKSGPSLTTQAWKQIRNLGIVTDAYAIRINDPDKSMSDIYEEVAERYNLGIDSIKGIYEEYSKRLRRNTPALEHKPE